MNGSGYANASYPQVVKTPNGPGYLIGRSVYGNLVVKHAAGKMTGTEAGLCVMGDNSKGALWEYGSGLVTFENGLPVVANGVSVETNLSLDPSPEGKGRAQ